MNKYIADRFCEYAKIDTQSDPDSTSFPSTEKQKDLKIPYQVCHTKYLDIALKILDRYRATYYKELMRPVITEKEALAHI